MRGDLMFAGVGMVCMAILLIVAILQWSVGPEFWWFVLGFFVFGISCVVEAWRMT
jgi:hypothetical protein